MSKKKTSPRREAIRAGREFLKAFTPEVKVVKSNAPRQNFDIAEMRRVVKERMKPHRKV